MALRPFLLALVLHSVFPEPAHAYIDPSAGSFVIQIAAGVLLGGLLTVRGWWSSIGHRTKSVWHRIRHQ